MQRVRVRKLTKKGQRKSIHEKKWHKSLLDNVKSVLKEACPVLDLEHKNLFISIEIDKYQAVSNIRRDYSDWL